MNRMNAAAAHLNFAGNTIPAHRAATSKLGFEESSVAQGSSAEAFDHVRLNKVLRLRAAIEGGCYFVPARDVADAICRFSAPFHSPRARRPEQMYSA